VNVHHQRATGVPHPRGIDRFCSAGETRGPARAFARHRQETPSRFDVWLLESRIMLEYKIYWQRKPMKHKRLRRYLPVSALACALSLPLE
jgi:hypothetical protein